MSRRSSVLGLLRLAHESSLEPGAWGVFLDALSVALDGRGGGLVHHRVSGGLTGAVVAQARLPQEATDLYSQHYGALDPWAHLLNQRRQFDHDYIASSDALISGAALRRTEYYTDFASRFDLVRSIAFGVRTDPGTATSFIIVRGRLDEPFDPRSVRLVSLLQPHIAQAFRVHQRLSETADRCGALEAAAGQLRTGLLLLDRAGRVSFMNREAERIVQLGDGVNVRGRRLEFWDRAAHARITDAVTTILGGLEVIAARGAAAPIVARRPSQGRSLVVVVSPIPPRDGGARACVFITDPQASGIDTVWLRGVFGLTEAEGRFATLLLRGHSVVEAAEQAHVTLNTARWFVRQLIRKTEARSLHDLIRILLAAGPPK